MRLPAYHPDTPEVRHDWAQYYDKITEMDAIAGRHLQELEEAGLAEDTIVFFYGDNGSGMPRSKRWPYNSGLQVPLHRFTSRRSSKHLAPKDYKPGGPPDRLVGFVDFAPTLLSLAGVKAPDWMQGHAFLGSSTAPAPEYLHGLRGRMDERYDLVRSVRNERYVYIRNYMPHLIYGQYINYMFQTPTTRVWKQLYDEGKLKPPQTFFWEPKPAEELYDLQTDPDEVKNLVGSPRTPGHPQRTSPGPARACAADPRYRFAHRIRATPPRCRHDPLRNGPRQAKYPLDKILTMADAASSLKPMVGERL